MVGYRTASGARRSGDDYQDLVAAEAFLRVLKHPSRYLWVKLEAKEAGRLDDVLILRSDSTVEATQVKYSTDALRPGDPWTWKKLLEEPRGKKSLIKAWHESVSALEELYDGVEPRLVSNRIAGGNLALLDSGKVDLAKLPTDVHQDIRGQLGEKTDDFLERFRFRVDQEDLGTLMRVFSFSSWNSGSLQLVGYRLKTPSGLGYEAKIYLLMGRLQSMTSGSPVNGVN